MVGVDVRRNFFEFSLSRIAKTALVKSFCEKSDASDFSQNRSVSPATLFRVRRIDQHAHKSKRSTIIVILCPSM